MNDWTNMLKRQLRERGYEVVSAEYREGIGWEFYLADDLVIEGPTPISVERKIRELPHLRGSGGGRVDADLTGTWIFVPEGDGRRIGGIYIVGENGGYGEPPYRFRATKQNGSRLHLRLITADGQDARYPADAPYLAGERIERRAYTSEMRRGIYWKREEE